MQFAAALKFERPTLSSPTEVLFVKNAAKSLICIEISLLFANITYILELNR